MSPLNFLIDPNDLIKILAASVYPDCVTIRIMSGQGRSLILIEHKINNGEPIESCMYSAMSRRAVTATKGWEEDLQDFAAFAKNHRSSNRNVVEWFIQEKFQVNIPTPEINKRPFVPGYAKVSQLTIDNKAKFSIRVGNRVPEATCNARGLLDAPKDQIMDAGVL